MVEGPGNKLKGEKMKATVVGQVVNSVEGPVAELGNKKSTNLQKLVGRRIVDVKTLGKELFLIFDQDICLRVHFLMSGFVRYNQKSSDPDELQHAGAKVNTDTDDRGLPQGLQLELRCSKDLVSLHQCSVEIRPTEPSLQRWEAMISLDICWAQFDATRTFHKILEPKNQERLVADVLMDQEVLPGVGNIIKNEACFNAGVNPLSMIKDVPEGVIRRLVRRTREFSMVFYQCRKTGKPLSKHYKIYRFSECADCGGRTTKCHPGEYKRGTYFCPRCQANRETMAAKKGSLLGWATTAAAPSLPSWQCPACTLNNKGGSPACSACGSKALSTSTGPSSWNCAACTLTNKPGNLACSACGGPRLESQGKTEDALVDLQKGTKRKREDGGDQSCKMPRVLGTNQVVQTNGTLEVNFNNQSNKVSLVLCSGHSKPCLVKTVSKEGPNKLRLFHCCSLPRAKQCQHFSWADLHHPKCKCGRLTILKEVFKLNQNNGREFFICPKSKKEQCDFFQWNL